MYIYICVCMYVYVYMYISTCMYTHASNIMPGAPQSIPKTCQHCQHAHAHVHKNANTCRHLFQTHGRRQHQNPQNLPKSASICPLPSAPCPLPPAPCPLPPAPCPALPGPARPRPRPGWALDPSMKLSLSLPLEDLVTAVPHQLTKLAPGHSTEAAQPP